MREPRLFHGVVFETTGSLAIVQPVFTLIALVALPLLWAALAAIFARPTGAKSKARASRHDASSSSPVVVDVLASIVAITCAVATLGITLILATRLALLPHGHVLVQHVSQLARLGQLDLAFDLALDPRGATFAVIISTVACGSTLHTAWSSRPNAGPVLAWTGLLTAGALLLCVGDGFAPILIGLGLLSLAAWGLSRGGDPTSNASALAGNISVLLGLVFLFWSLGGAFGPEGYDPDGAPRFVLVATGSGSGSAVGPNKATLAMTTHTGALVSSDDADLPGEPVTSPFSIAVSPGIYTLRVQGGPASGDVVVPRVAFTANRTYVLTPYGPTASLRVLDDQVGVPRLAPSGGIASVRAALAARTIGGLRSSAIVLLLALGGALAHVHALANRRGPSAIASVLEAIPVPYLALRLAPLVDPSGPDGALVAMLGAGSAVVLSARGACVDDGHKALRAVLGAAMSVGLAAAGLGEPSAVLVLTGAATVGTAAALAAIDARRDVRWLGVACASAVGLLPGAGASSGYILVVTAALGSATTGSIAWAAFAALIAIAIVCTCALSALAAFRVYDAVIRASVRDPGMSRGQGAVVILLSVLSLVGGTALGAGTTAFGGQVVPLARRLSGPLGAVSLPKSMAAAALMLSLVAAAGGVILARRVSHSASPPGWLLALSRPYDVLVWTSGTIGGVAQFLERSVRAMDRDVVDDVPAAIRDVAIRASNAIGRLRSGGSGKEAERASPVLERGGTSGAVIVKLEVDDPRSTERFRTIVILAMVALLGLVVLSSFLLGW